MTSIVEDRHSTYVDFSLYAGYPPSTYLYDEFQALFPETAELPKIQNGTIEGSLLRATSSAMEIHWNPVTGKKN